jgi:hypothetical protein
MTRYDRLPIWKDTRLAVLLEEAVRRFPRYHQCSLGADLGREAYAVANGERDGRAGWPVCRGDGRRLSQAPTETSRTAGSRLAGRVRPVKIHPYQHRGP